MAAIYLKRVYYKWHGKRKVLYFSNMEKFFMTIDAIAQKFYLYYVVNDMHLG